MSKKYTEHDLLDSIDVVSTITCSKCEEEDEVSDDWADAIKYFFGEGWRATERHTYCPKCAKKYLKQKL